MSCLEAFISKTKTTWSNPKALYCKLSILACVSSAAREDVMAHLRMIQQLIYSSTYCFHLIQHQWEICTFMNFKGMYESRQGAVHYRTLYTKKVVRFVTSSKTRHIAGTHWVIRVKMVTWLKCTSLWVLWSQRLILAFLMVDFVKNLTTFHLVHYSVFTPVSTLIVLYMKHDLWGMSQGFRLTQALLTGFLMVSAFPTFWLLLMFDSCLPPP